MVLRRLWAKDGAAYPCDVCRGRGSQPGVAPLGLNTWRAGPSLAKAAWTARLPPRILKLPEGCKALELEVDIVSEDCTQGCVQQEGVLM